MGSLENCCHILNDLFIILFLVRAHLELNLLMLLLKLAKVENAKPISKDFKKSA